MTVQNISTTRKVRPSSVTITPRKLGREYGDIPQDWFAANPFLTAMFNTLSAQFPPGERFLIQSARPFRDQLTDPQLKADVAGFIGQEARHAQEHAALSEALQRQGIPTDDIERGVKRILDVMCAHLSDKDQMAATAALEHFTSMLGSLVLSDPRILEDVHPSMRPLFLWHAIEECEHKAVAFDLYQAVDGNYPRLMLAYLTWTSLLVVVSGYYQLRLMRLDKRAFRPKAVLSGLNWMFGFGRNAGHMRKMIPDFFDFFRPNFHPWQHDNSQAIGHWKRVLDELEQQPHSANDDQVH